MRSLDDYRAMLERIDGGTIPAALGLEIIHTAEAELQEARGEFTVAQAMEKSGRSRSYFERRLSKWAQDGLARKPGRDWLLKAAAIPGRDTHGGFDESLSPSEVAAALWRRAS